MEPEKLNIVVPESGKAEVIIREGSAPEQLREMAPIQIDIKGTIGAPHQFLSQRMAFLNKENELNFMANSHILVNREKMSITLIINESDHYKRGKIVGEIKTHSVFEKFGINSDKDWEPNKLGQFCKMNRAFFESLEANMMLVSVLKNFNAKIDSMVEKQSEQSGGFKDNYSAVVTSNLPMGFNLSMPLFVGGKKEFFEVEFDATVNGRAVFLNLISPGANATLELVRDTAIDEQLNLIRDVAPGIVIIEQ